MQLHKQIDEAANSTNLIRQVDNHQTHQGFARELLFLRFFNANEDGWCFAIIKVKICLYASRGVAQSVGIPIGRLPVASSDDPFHRRAVGLIGEEVSRGTRGNLLSNTDAKMVFRC